MNTLATPLTTTSENSSASTLHSVLHRNLIFVHGKGGVGKTLVSQAIALELASQGAKTLWVTIEDPTRPPGEVIKMSPSLFHMNCDFTTSFEEYVSMKIGVATLTRIFLQNKLMRYLAKAAPGIHELVLLGKIWFERNHYDHVIVDMPSTGYGLAMFQSAANFVKLFHGGPLNRDADAMLATFRTPEVTGHLIVALPEEMPLRESIELNDYLKSTFPENPAAFLVNRLFPEVPTSNETDDSASPQQWPSPLAHSAKDYSQKRSTLEKHNLRLWRDPGINFGELPYIPPPPQNNAQTVVEKLALQLKCRAYL